MWLYAIKLQRYNGSTGKMYAQKINKKADKMKINLKKEKIIYMVRYCLYKFIKRRKLYLLKKKKPHQYKLLELKNKGAKIGDSCLIMSSVIVAEPILLEIGNNVIISGYSYLLTHDGSPVIFEETKDKFIYGSIKIGNNVFVGIGTIILPGVEIGDNVIIGAGSVVRGKVPSNSVIMGNPAKIIFKTSIAKKMMVNNKNLLTADILLSDLEQDKMLLNHFKMNLDLFDKSFYLRE